MVETETVRKRVSASKGIPRDRIFVVGNSYSAIFRERLRRCSSGKSSGQYTVLVPSSYYPHKNLEIVPKVAAAIGEFTDRAVKFLLTLPIGEPPWAKLQAEARRLGVGLNIDSAGFVPHERIADLYAQAHAVFLPTLLECSTAVYPESMFAGLPIVTSDLDFARELCEGAALYVDPFDSRAAAESLARVLTDSSERDSLVREGQKVLVRKYPSPEDAWRKRLECLQRVVDWNRN
jgi:glycosyltransferase involved in cell wall biosynthesis